MNQISHPGKNEPIWQDARNESPPVSARAQRAARRMLNVASVLLTCREHPKRPFRIEIDTTELQDVFCTDCGYLRTYHPGDELEDE